MYEVENIRRLVKEIDRRFDCHWEPDSEEYAITQTSPLGHTSWFASVRYDQLSRDFFDNIRKSIYINRNGDALKHVETSQRNAQERKEREADGLIEYVAKDIAKPVYNALMDL